MKNLIMGMLAGAALAVTTPGFGQYLYLDSSGDGWSSRDDVVGGVNDTTSIAVWLVTDRQRDGSLAVNCLESGMGPHINSYELVMRAVNGTVSWGEYNNHLKSMTYQYGPRTSGTDFYIGYAGTERLPPGKYKLGSISVVTASGAPEIIVAESTPLWGPAATSFGSDVPGRNQDNTLRYSPETRIGGPGDWHEAFGLAQSAKGSGARATQVESAPAVFAVSLARNPSRQGARLRVTLARPGLLRIRVFDLEGRLVRTVVDSGKMTAGQHEFNLAEQGELACGVYFYRVESAEGRRQGKIVTLK